jgi:hypothetical protein
VPFETKELLFQPPDHFYSPIGDRAEMHQHFTRLQAAAPPRSVPCIRIDDGAMLALRRRLVREMARLFVPGTRRRDGARNPGGGLWIRKLR